MKKVKKVKKVFAYAHTHWDREWYKEFEEFRVRLIDVFDDILDKLQRNEIKSFYFDGQTAAPEDYLEIKSDRAQLITDLIKDKRLFIGPYYCSTDSFLVDAESLIRNLQFGIKTSHEFGCKDFIAYHADTFGHSAQLPFIVKYFGIGYGIFWRGCGELPSGFNFNGLKSTYLIQGYFQDFFSLNVPAEKKAEMLKNTLDKIAVYSSDNLLLPLGADHLALADDLEKQIEEVNEYLTDYEIILTTPFEYFKHAGFETEVKNELRDNSRNFILPGVFSSRIDIKKANSALEWKLSRISEPMQAIFSYLGKTKNYQPEIDYAYKTLIKNQAHDSIYGCSKDSVHFENLLRYENVKQCANAVENAVKRDIYSKDICILNMGDFEFNGAVKIKTTKKLNAQLISKTRNFPFKKTYDVNQIPVTEDYTDIYEYLIDVKNIAPYSMTKVYNFKSQSQTVVTNNSIENKKIKLEVINGKINILDKQNDKFYGDFLKITDRADIGDSYNFGALKDDKKIAAEIKKVKCVEKGSVRSGLKITYEIAIPKTSHSYGRSKIIVKHTVDMFVYLENQDEFLRFELRWNNKSLNHILQVEFNFDTPVEKTVSDDLTGLTERNFDSEYDIYKHIPASRGVELKYNIAPAQSFVSAQTAVILTKRSIEYEVFKNTLSLTLLRATGIISNPKNPTRGTPAGPPFETPDLQMLKEIKDEFAVFFTDDCKNAYRLSQKYRECAFAVRSDSEFSQIFDVSNNNILISAIKTNKYNNLIMRFNNKSELNQNFDFKTTLPHKKIFIADALENIQSEYKPCTIAGNGFITLLLQN